jgi:phage baseplate assembly protein V
MDYDSDHLWPRNKTGRDSEVRNLHRIGKVVEVLVDESRVNCRVQFLDMDGLISRPLPVKQFGSRSTSAFWCPKVGDDVSVTFDPNSTGSGYIDGSFYNVGNPPPITDPNTRHIKFADGAIFEYTEKSGQSKELRGTANTPRGAGTGTLTFKGAGPIDVSTPADTTIICANLIIQGNVQITGNVSIKGNLSVEGDISNTGNMTTGGTHTDSIGRHDA